MESKSVSFLAFIREFGGNMFALMSGGPSVPLAIAAFYVENSTAKMCLAITAIVCIIAASYLVWRKQTLAVLAAEEKLEEMRALTSANFIRDVWFQDAVFYRLEGRWPCKEERLIPQPNEADEWESWEKRIESSEIFKNMKKVLAEMRQAAFEERLHVWGRRNSFNFSLEIVGDPLFVPVPFSQWADYETSPLELAFEPEKIYMIKRESICMDDGSFSSLMVSKSQVERLWPLPISGKNHVTRQISQP